MATLVDSYSEGNAGDNTSSIVGQSFTGNGGVLNSAKFYMEKDGSPTGNLYAKIYSHSGTFGTTGIPSSLLATSDAVDVSTVSDTPALQTFAFTGANKITLTNGTKYVVVIENIYNFPNYSLAYRDGSSPTHNGNFSYYSGGWNYDAALDLIFYVYSDDVTTTTSLTSTSTTSTSLTTQAPTVMRVSKPEKDVLTSTSPDDFYLDSNYPLLKIHSFGTFSFAINSERTTIVHNLGYRPYVLVFSKYVNSSSSVSNELYQHDWFVGGASASWWGYTKIYSNKIVIEVGQTLASSPVTQITGFYYIFKDEV
jgi:hypothetical protein